MGRARVCESCGETHFPRTDPAIIVAITDDQDRLLLGHHRTWKPGRYSLLAGFAEAGESLEQAVVREMAEEVRIEVRDITYAGSQPWPMPRSLMVGFWATATSTLPQPDGEEITAASWFSRQDLTEMVSRQEVSLPLDGSIAHRLITRWLGDGMT